MWVLISLAVLLVALTHWLLKGSFGYWQQRGVPSPPTKPWVGNLGAAIVFTKSLCQIYTDMYNNYRDCLYIGCYKFQRPALLIRDVDLIKNVLIKDFPSFHDNDIDGDVSAEPLLAKNPFGLKGNEWKVVRGQISSAVTTEKVKNMFTLMCEAGTNLVTYLNTEAGVTGADGLDAKELAAKFTTDVVATCAFGLEANSFTDPDSEFRKMGRKLFTPSFGLIIRYLMVFLLPRLATLFKIKLIPDEVNAWFVGTLSETIKYREQNNIKRNDYFDMMLSLKTKPGEHKFTDADVMAQAMTFYGNGLEPSSVVLSFTLYELAKNPDVQDKLRNEVDTVLAKHGDGEITYEAVQEMSYLDKVISESVRKYPPATYSNRVCTKQHRFCAPKGAGSGPEVVIEPGTSVLIPVYAIHHDPQFYPDPEKFLPDRFTEEAVSARPKCSYLAFGEGPRMCLGFRFARLQMKAALVSIVTNFEIKENPKTTPSFEIDPKYPLLAKKGGIWLNFRKRMKECNRKCAQF